MKKSFQSLLIFLAVTLNSNSQDPCPPNNITTNPANPVNTHRPSRLNNFNWMLTPYNINTSNTGQTTLNNPFYTTANEALLPFYDPPDGYRDMQPEGGWEIVHKDLGYYDNGSVKIPAPEVIYYILYNKYTSVLRFFGARSNQQLLNGARVEIKLNSLLSLPSVLDLSAPLQPLDNFNFSISNLPVLGTYSQFLTSSLKWFYADFPLMYDPCTCLFQSGMIVKIYFSNTGTITLTGNSSGTIVSQGAQEPSTVTNQSFSLGDTRFGKVVNAFKSSTAFENLTKPIAETKSGNANASNGITNLKTEMKKKNFLRTGLSFIPYINDAVSIFDALFAGGKSDPGSNQVEIMPMTINLNTNFSGTLEFNYAYTTPTFRVPGSNIPSYVSDEEYPYYNEILGTFNIVKKPKVSILQYTWMYTSFPSPQYIRQSRIKLIEPIKFVINPAARVNVMEVNIALIGRDLNKLVQTVGSGGPLGGGVIRFDKINAGYNEYRTEYAYNGFWGFYAKYVSDGSTYPDQFYSPLVMKVMVRLRRQDALNNPNIQDILWVNTYPVTLHEVIGTGSVSDWNAFNSNIPGYELMSPADVTSFCNSSVYKTAGRNFRRYQEIIDSVEKASKARNLIGLNNDLFLFRVLPNPAQTLMKIEYGLKTDSEIKIIISDINGSEVQKLFSSSMQRKGYYYSTYKLKNLPNGVYIVSVITTSSISTRKLVIAH